MLGASGRAGRAIGGELVRRGREVVLVGRDRARLSAVASQGASGAGLLVVDGAGRLASAMHERKPAVLVNAVGPFRAIAVRTARACLRQGVHYLDLANELEAVISVLALDEQARTAGCTLVTGAGFGVVATEAVTLAIRGAHPPAAQARVAATPVVDRFGPSVLANVIDSIAGGRRYTDGRIEPCRLGTDFALTLPDGSSVATLAVPTGELEAARRASGAANAVAASSEMPTGGAARRLLPLLGRAIGVRPVRRGLLALVARLRLAPPATSTGETSWAHAELRWSDETSRPGWLQTGEAYAFTAMVAAEVACVLADGRTSPGAHTPGRLLGRSLAKQAGGQLIIQERA